jgi:hypothetical protein
MLSSGACFERVRLLSLPDDPPKAAGIATNALPPYFWFALEVRISGQVGFEPKQVPTVLKPAFDLGFEFRTKTPKS